MERESKDQPWAPVAFYSKGLNSAQQKYSTYDRELLTCYLAVKKFHHFLDGQQFQLLTNHKSLIPSHPWEKTRDWPAAAMSLAKTVEVWKAFEDNRIAILVYIPCCFPTEIFNSHPPIGASNARCLQFAVKPHQPIIPKPTVWWSAGIGHSKMPFPLTTIKQRMVE